MPRCPTCDAAFAAGERFCPHDGAALRDSDQVETKTDTDNLIGRTIDSKYRLDEKIGAGGMGSVYRGRHLLMDRKVAVKVVRPEVAADDKTLKRFHREAKHSCRLDHPNCVRVTDFGSDAQGLLYLVMEYLDGKTVGEEVYYDGPMAARRVAHVGAQAARALQHAHALGIVHRDLKPDNIMLVRRDDDPDFVKVLDFGLAKLLERDEHEPAITNPSFGSLTEAGIVFGTPEYMSPEQAAGNPIDPRTDLYSLGAVLYQMVTGQLLFDGDTFMAILTKHVTEAPVAPAARRPDLAIPPELDRVIMACLAKDPSARPVDAGALGEMLEAVAAALPATGARIPQALSSAATIDLTAQAHGAGIATVPQPVVTHAVPPELEVTLPTAVRARRSPLRWALPALAIAAAAASIVVLLASGEDAPAPRAAGPVTPPDAAVIARAPLADAAPAPLDAHAGTAFAAADAGARRAVDHDRRRARRDDPELSRHLAAAEQAHRARRWLKVIAEADQALRIAPGHRRAAWLMGVAQLESGDKTNGCEYLRKAGNRWGASARMQRAGCGD